MWRCSLLLVALFTFALPSWGAEVGDTPFAPEPEVPEVDLADLFLPVPTVEHEAFDMPADEPEPLALPRPPLARVWQPRTA